MKHLKYLSYVLRHKWYVFLECCKYGLVWRGIVHDLSKFRPREWFAYAEHFYGPNSHDKDGRYTPMRDKTGYYKPIDTGDAAFDRAWFWHQKVNSHHWQFWFQIHNTDDIHFGTILEMPHNDMVEMFCDWHGASRAQGNKSTVPEWWQANKSKIRLHLLTREWLQNQIELWPST